MKIAHVIASIELQHGGPSRSSVGLASGLAALDHQVELLATAEEAAEEKNPPLTIHRFKRGFPRRFSASAPMSRHLRRERFEVLHHHGLWLRPLHYVHRQARADSVPFVISPRGMMTSWAWHHHRFKKRLADRLVHPGALQAAAGWHATSEAEAADIRNLGFRQPICVAPNGVELPSDPQLQLAREFWHDRAPALRERKVALFYSRLHSKKRIVELIDLWRALAPKDWLLLVVGIPDQFSVRQLEEQILREGAKDQILVFDGTYQPPPYAVAELCILPSHSENFGLVVAEALAAEVPVLTTDATPWAELNTRGVGWCVNYAQFDDALREALAEPPAQLRQRGEAGREWVKHDFTWPVIAARLAEFYRELHRPH